PFPPSLFTHPPPPQPSTPSLHDALPISRPPAPPTFQSLTPPKKSLAPRSSKSFRPPPPPWREASPTDPPTAATSARRIDSKPPPDRKSTRLNSSHVKISYAVFCLKKKIT